MPSWNSDQYLKFARERTQPSLDLVARIDLTAPARIIDLGCGPGNSTAVLTQHWPHADVTGFDSSSEMIAAAQKKYPRGRWLTGDLATWGVASDQRYDVVFSNAAIHWVPNHAESIPRLFSAVAPGGALAFQVPHSLGAPHQRCIRELAASPAWRSRFSRPPVSWHVESPGFYYDRLAPLARSVELWLTDYMHVLSGPEAIVEWHRGTGLRPFLDQLPDDTARDEFLRDYLAAITPHYPLQTDGNLLLPFRRFFLVAYA